MHAHPRLLRFTVLLVVLNLVLNSVAPALLAQDGTPLFLPWVTNGIAPASATTTEGLLLRTRISVHTPAQWRDLDRLGAVTLAKGDDWAQLLVDDQQLATLARWRYSPEVTDTLTTLAGANPALAAGFATLLQREAVLSAQLAQASAVDAAAQRAELHTLMQAVSAQQIEALAQAASVDTDGDGLTDDQEGWWCTDPAKADTDFDGRSDGTEINAVKAWMNNERVAPPGGTPWTDWPFGSTCPDKDFDSVPNLAETRELGLNADLESTDRDQFDDGQELFGTTKCPGSATACGYGSLPPANTAGIVLFPEMPGWVRAPGNHPLAAGLPLIKIDVDNANLKITTVTEVTTDRVITSGTEKSYSTAKTEGTSTSVANTTTWEEWQEISLTTPELQASSVDVLPAILGFIGLELAGAVVSEPVNCIFDELAGDLSRCSKIYDQRGELKDAMVGGARETIYDPNEGIWKNALKIGTCAINKIGCAGNLGISFLKHNNQRIRQRLTEDTAAIAN